MNEQQKLEISTAYKDMMNGWAFKDLMSRVEAERMDRVNQVLTQKGSDNLELVKGFNACVDFIKGELGIVTGLTK